MAWLRYCRTPGERLLALLGLGAKPFAVRPRQRLQEPLVERVAIAGDSRHQLRERDGRIVVTRPRAADARAHQDRAGEHRRGLEEPFALVAARPGRGIDPSQQRVERHLPEHEAAEVTAVVDGVRVPLAEEHVRPLVDRVEVVVGPRVEREFVEMVGVEARLVEQDGSVFASSSRAGRTRSAYLPGATPAPLR